MPDLHEMSVKRRLTEGALKYEILHDVYMSDFNQVSKRHYFKTFFLFCVPQGPQEQCWCHQQLIPQWWSTKSGVVEVLLNIFRAAWA